MKISEKIYPRQRVSTEWMAEFTKNGESYCDGWIGGWHHHHVSSTLEHTRDINLDNNEYYHSISEPEKVNLAMVDGWLARETMFPRPAKYPRYGMYGM